MFRKQLKYLDKWKDSPQRKPLIIRGARQVGKTELVREFGRSRFLNVIEINFDHPDNGPLKSVFASESPQKIIQILETHFKTKIIPQQTLLFLDEIQNVPKLLPQLRYFYEDLPQLHVISAGSLLEFILNEHDFSMPVGRIEYLHLSQMDFEEFLIATGESALLTFLENFSIKEKIPEPFHKRLIESVRLYIVLGGMPEVIRTYCEQKGIEDCLKTQSQILTTFQDDFFKYKKRLDQTRLRNVFRRIPLLVGQKIKYVNIDPNEQSRPLAQTLDLLCLARICARVYHSSCQGTPLRAQINERVFKLLFLDVGLMCHSCGVGYLDVKAINDLILINQGALTEQFVGQHLLYQHPPYEEPELFYWMREKKNAAAEVDYVITHGQTIVPVEVKSGSTGRLKSLHTFLSQHNLNWALRFNGDYPSLLKTKTALPTGNVTMHLCSLPFYLIGQTKRILEEIICS
ncbi:MAG: ATP-binding protein [Deltaproteobacteria bacterium]|nr:ATP-binding protein [Deltaproteobacteria bacterium]